MVNNTNLIGRLTKDPDFSYTSIGKVVANFTLAVNQNFTNNQGEREDDFIPCVKRYLLMVEKLRQMPTNKGYCPTLFFSCSYLANSVYQIHCDTYNSKNKKRDCKKIFIIF